MAIKVTFTGTVPTPSNVSDETFAMLLGGQYVAGELTIDEILSDAIKRSSKFEVEYDG